MDRVRDHPAPSSADRLALPALLVANAALACGPWLVRLAESHAQVGALASAFWRLALALPVLLVATRVGGERLDVRRGSAVALLAVAGLLFAADLALWHLGILHTRLANATLLGNVTAILFPLYGFLVARRWPRRIQAIALLLAAGGVTLLVGRSYEMSARNLAGDLLCIGAGLFYTGYMVAIEQARRRLGPVITLTGAVMAGGPALLATVLILREPLWPATWGPLLLLSAGSQLVGQGLILFAVARVSPLVVGLMLLVQPVVGAGIGFLIYGERLTWADLAGGAAIALALILVRSPTSSDASAKAGIDE